MKNKECDIIKDLLPSYVDEICSEASKELVEEHLKGCQECKKTVEMLKNTELSSKQLEQESLDAGRKVIRQNLRRSMLNLGLCLLMAFLMIFVFEVDNIQIPHLALYIALPICALMTWLVCRNQTKRRGWDKWDTLLAIGTVLATGYGVFMMLYGFSQVIKEGTVFGLPSNEIGPFLYARMVLSAVICFVIYFVQMVRTVKHGRNNSIVMQLCLTGIFLMMAYCINMGYLTNLDVVVQLKKETTIVLAGGLLNMFTYGAVDIFTKG